MGTKASGARLARMQASPQWKTDGFVNPLPPREPAMLPALKDYLGGGTSAHATPDAFPAVASRTADDFASPPESGLRVTWLGHSTLLVEIDGQRVLFDPVWSERASPFTWAGPRRFHEAPLPFDQLPPVDVVAISHDHYDHLDHRTVVRLAATDATFLVPLGVGAHLEYWGVDPGRIVELDWWGKHRIGELELVATPARHFSGRSLFMADRDRTLWAGWAVVGPKHRVYYSGDTGMFPGFSEIGERLGPFDVTMIESGAYNRLWADLHLGPEQAVQAHRMVRGKVMIPVHWGTFNLAMHAWTEPAERVLAAARLANVTVAIPRPGASVQPGVSSGPEPWWPSLQIQSAADHPVVSSGLDETLRDAVTPPAGARP